MPVNVMWTAIDHADTALLHMVSRSENITMFIATDPRLIIGQ